MPLFGEQHARLFNDLIEETSHQEGVLLQEGGPARPSRVGLERPARVVQVCLQGFEPHPRHRLPVSPKPAHAVHPVDPHLNEVPFDGHVGPGDLLHVHRFAGKDIPDRQALPFPDILHLVDGQIAFQEGFGEAFLFRGQRVQPPVAEVLQDRFAVCRAVVVDEPVVELAFISGGPLGQHDGLPRFDIPEDARCPQEVLAEYLLFGVAGKAFPEAPENRIGWGRFAGPRFGRCGPLPGFLEEAAPLVFLSASAGARLVPADLLSRGDRRLPSGAWVIRMGESPSEPFRHAHEHVEEAFLELIEIGPDPVVVSPVHDLRGLAVMGKGGFKIALVKGVFTEAGVTFHR